jgi:hypothetical protein
MDGLEQLSVNDWELLRLSTDQISVDVLPGIGGTIVSLRRRSDDTELLWRSPWGIRQRGAHSLPGSSEAVMLDTYPGGWQTLLPNGGDTSIVSGVEWGHDGETRLAPFSWDYSEHQLVLRTRLVRAPLEVTKVISVSGTEVTVAETVTNAGAESLELIWGQQITFGEPLISGDTSVDAAAVTVHPDPEVSPDASYEDVMPWPRSYGSYAPINLRNLPGPNSYETRLAYVTDFTEHRLSIHNRERDLGVDLEWDGDTWPFLWYSMEAGARSGFPWFSDGYFFSLTPCSSWPAHGLHDARGVEQTTLWMHAKEVREGSLTLRVHPETSAG